MASPFAPMLEAPGEQLTAGERARKALLLETRRRFEASAEMFTKRARTHWALAREARHKKDKITRAQEARIARTWFKHAKCLIATARKLEGETTPPKSAEALLPGTVLAAA